MNADLILPIVDGFLRPLLESDIHKDYVDGLNDPSVNQYLNSVKNIQQTYQSVRDFVIANQMAPDSILWGIWLNESSNHIGTVRLHGIDLMHRTAYIGVCIFNKKYWKRRLGSEGISAVTRWAFDKLKLRWVEAGIYDENIPSQSSFLSSGYKWIYDIPGKYCIDGVPVTVKVYVAKNVTY